jgi:signal recognition particle subunit SRP19
MPTVEDYNEEEEDQPTGSFVFDDDTDLPLPDSTPATSTSNPRRALPNTGTRGVLLSHIDDDQVDFDLAKIQEQGRGIENVGAPAISSRTTTTTRSGEDGSNRPIGPATGAGPGGMGGMGGIMGDLMKIQEAEDQRMRKLEKQLGSTRFVKDPEEFKRYVQRSLFPIFPLPCPASFEDRSTRLAAHLTSPWTSDLAGGIRSTRSTLMRKRRRPQDVE